MTFYLIDSGYDAGNSPELFQMANFKITDTNG